MWGLCTVRAGASAVTEDPAVGGNVIFPQGCKSYGKSLPKRPKALKENSQEKGSPKMMFCTPPGGNRDLHPALAFFTWCGAWAWQSLTTRLLARHIHGLVGGMLFWGARLVQKAFEWGFLVRFSVDDSQGGSCLNVRLTLFVYLRSAVAVGASTRATFKTSCRK